MCLIKSSKCGMLRKRGLDVTGNTTITKIISKSARAGEEEEEKLIQLILLEVLNVAWGIFRTTNVLVFLCEAAENCQGYAEFTEHHINYRPD